MSRFEYQQGMSLAIASYPFYALIQAAMRGADTDNLEKLKAAFPATWDELQKRYHAPGGLLPGEGQN